MLPKVRMWRLRWKRLRFYTNARATFHWNLSLQGKFGRLDAVVNCAGIGVAFKVYNFNKDRAHSQEDFVKVVILRSHDTMKHHPHLGQFRCNW